MLGVVAAPMLAACGGDDNVDGPPTSFTMSSSPVATLPGFEDPQRWAGRTLRIGAWGGEIQQALRERMWGPFARLTGCVIQEMSADYAHLATSLGSSEGPYLDLLVADAFWASGALARGDVEPIPADRIDGALFVPVPAFDGAIPAYAYAMVSAFRRDVITVDSALDSWRRWWDVSALPGARALPEHPVGALEFALLADGVTRDELYPLDIARAIGGLQAISSEIADRWWASGEQPVIWMANGRAQLAAAWHYRVIAGQQDGRPVDFVWDDALLVADQWVIPHGSPATDVALDFLAFASEPAVQASLAAVVPLGPTVAGAFDLIDGRTAARLPTAPGTRSKLVLADAAWWGANRAAAVEAFEQWRGTLPASGA